jgi:hypothetical protein
MSESFRSSTFMIFPFWNKVGRSQDLLSLAD